MANGLLVRPSGRWLLIHGGPVLTAAALAGLSILPVAWSLTLEPRRADASGWQQPAAWQALVAAASVALASAVVAGAVAGRVRRRRSVTGAAVALFIAWPVAIGLLPILGAATGATFRYGVLCIDTCSSPMLTDAEPLTGIGAWGEGLVLSIVLGLPDVGLILFGLVSLFLVRHRLPGLAVIFGVLAYASLHALFFLFEPVSIVGFACLGVGVVLWWAWLFRRDFLLSVLAAPGGDTTGTGAERVELLL